MSVGWTTEWAVALRRRRLLALNAGIPLLLVAPVVVAPTPPAHAAAVLAVLFVIFGTFGSAIPLVRDGSSGLLLRFLLAGESPRAHLAGRLAAQTALDGVALTPALVLTLAVEGTGSAETAAVVAGLGLALGVANVLGAWVAAAARSLAEAALFAAVTALLLLHGAGVFRTPSPASWQAALETWIPFRPLHEALLGALGTGALPDGAVWGPSVAAAGAVVGLTWLASPRLLHRLAAHRDR